MPKIYTVSYCESDRMMLVLIFDGARMKGLNLRPDLGPLMGMEDRTSTEKPHRNFLYGFLSSGSSC